VVIILAQDTLHTLKDLINTWAADTRRGDAASLHSYSSDGTLSSRGSLLSSSKEEETSESDDEDDEDDEGDEVDDDEEGGGEESPGKSCA